MTIWQWESSKTAGSQNQWNPIFAQKENQKTARKKIRV
jgi:hypothetical protein